MNEKLVAQTILSHFPQTPKVAVVLGSGLGGFVDSLRSKMVIPYSDIKGYPQTTVVGHSGELVFGYKNSLPILCAKGRFHYYEGHPMKTVTFPIRVFKELGCETFIITNSAGCLRKDWKPGDLMIIDGIIDYSFIGKNPNLDITPVPHLIDDKLLEDVPLNNNAIRRGVYTYTLGPSYETPAEIQDIISIGGDAVGMSTVPEIKAAIAQQCNIIGISCLTNYGAGISPTSLNHEEVLETADLVRSSFGFLLEKVIASL
jgi:purine-nucleoside phosphorylase